MGDLKFFSNTKAAAEIDASKGETLRLIDIDLLVPNPNNKYRITDVSQLAGYMVANDFHVEPIEVMSIENGKYMIIAGHRRRAAWEMLLSKGETKERRLPCRICSFADESLSYKDENGAEQTDVITADQKAIVRLILSNLGQRKTKTLEEEVWEIEQLTPYARSLYNETREKANGSIGTFKNFFAKEILQISPSALQRKRGLARLSEDAQKALYEEGIINESVAIEISGLPDDEQDRYVNGVRSGEISPNVMDAREFKKGSTSGEGTAQEGSEPEKKMDSEGVTEDEASSKEDDDVHETQDEGVYEENKNSANMTKPQIPPSIPVPKDIKDPEAEAREWFLKSLELIMEDAEKKKLECEANGDEVGEAQWGIRWAVVKQKIVEFRANS